MFCILFGEYNLFSMSFMYVRLEGFYVYNVLYVINICFISRFFEYVYTVSVYMNKHQYNKFLHEFIEVLIFHLYT